MRKVIDGRLINSAQEITDRADPSMNTSKGSANQKEAKKGDDDICPKYIRGKDERLKQ